MVKIGGDVEEADEGRTGGGEKGTERALAWKGEEKKWREEMREIRKGIRRQEEVMRREVDEIKKELREREER